MTAMNDLLIDAFDRIGGVVHDVLDGLGAEHLTTQLDPEANSIGWLVWHLSRVTDDHVAGVAGADQRWTAGGWADRFGLPYARDAIGYGQTAADVAAFDVTDPALLGDYLDEVVDAAKAYVATLGETDLARVVDESWDPPVTLAVRLVSVLSDALQHAGQAAYVKGVLQRRG